MNHDQILAIKKGRELDAIVAEKVMGLQREKRRIPCPDGIDGCAVAHYSYSPPYSTDISSAWELVEKLKGNGECQIYWWVDHWEAWIGKAETVKAETAPEAICKAALMAVLNV